MTTHTITVQTLTLGQHLSSEERQIRVPVLEEQLTVEAFIRLAVGERIREALARLRLKQLSREESMTFDPGLLTPQVEVEQAIRAFSAGQYLLIINQRRVNALDEKIIFTADTQVQFLQLMPLVGG
jgi:vacuolar-type H+-ATPase subunit D/Vma8